MPLDLELAQAALEEEKLDPFRGLRKAEEFRRVPGPIERLKALGQSYFYPQEVDIPGLGPENIQIGAMSRGSFFKGLVQALRRTRRHTVTGPESKTILDTYFGQEGVPRYTQPTGGKGLIPHPDIDEKLHQSTAGRDVIPYYDPRLRPLTPGVRAVLDKVLGSTGSMSEHVGELFSKNVALAPDLFYSGKTFDIQGARQAIREASQRALKERFRRLGHKEIPEEFVVFRAGEPPTGSDYNLANVTLRYNTARGFGNPENLSKSINAYLIKRSDVVADTHALGSAYTTEFELMVPKSVLAKRRAFTLPNNDPEHIANALERGLWEPQSKLPILPQEVVKFQKLSGVKGSNPGGFYRGKDNIPRYVKEYSDNRQAWGEFVSNRIYSALGLKVPTTTLVRQSNGGLGVATDVISNAYQVGQVGLDKTTAREVLKGYIADVWLSNWDAVGMNLDNIMVTPKGLVRIDQGGALSSRARGEMKTSKDLASLSELDNFPNPMKNPAYAKVFAAADMSKEELEREFVRQTKLIDRLWKESDINALIPGVKGVYNDHVWNTREVLNKRLGLLKQRFLGEEPVVAGKGPHSSEAIGELPPTEKTLPVDKPPMDLVAQAEMDKDFLETYKKFKKLNGGELTELEFWGLKYKWEDWLDKNLGVDIEDLLRKVTFQRTFEDTWVAALKLAPEEAKKSTKFYNKYYNAVKEAWKTWMEK